MIIKKMTASFGTLENETLELKDGLNIVRSPNESGKSTWCAFIKACCTVWTAPQEKRAESAGKVRFAP